MNTEEVSYGVRQIVRLAQIWMSSEKVLESHHEAHRKATKVIREKR